MVAMPTNHRHRQSIIKKCPGRYGSVEGQSGAFILAAFAGIFRPAKHQIQADFDAVAGQWIFDTAYCCTRL